MSARERFNRRNDEKSDDLSLWINEQQVRVFSGFSMKVFAIQEGKINPHLRDKEFSTHLPLIPSELNMVNFTWKAGNKKYRYNFDRLISLDPTILEPPTVSIKTDGRIPRKPKDFSISLACQQNASGIGLLSIGLSIENANGHPIPGEKIHLNFEQPPKN